MTYMYDHIYIYSKFYHIYKARFINGDTVRFTIARFIPILFERWFGLCFNVVGNFIRGVKARLLDPGRGANGWIIVKSMEAIKL